MKSVVKSGCGHSFWKSWWVWLIAGVITILVGVSGCGHNSCRSSWVWLIMGVATQLVRVFIMCIIRVFFWPSVGVVRVM